jgi:hypothetical protein
MLAEQLPAFHPNESDEEVIPPVQSNSAESAFGPAVVFALERVLNLPLNIRGLCLPMADGTRTMRELSYHPISLLEFLRIV